MKTLITKKIILVVFSIIFLCIIGYLFINRNKNYFTFQNTVAPTIKVTSTITKAPTLTPTPVPIDNGSLPVISPNTVFSNGIGYFSDTLVNFNFLASTQAEANVKIYANRIYIGYGQNLATNGASFLELFSKNPNETIQQAIQKTILTGYNLNDCPILNAADQGNQYFPSSWDSATINYAQSNYNPHAASFPIDPSECPVTFTHILNGSPIYFAVDPQRPTILMFFHIGGSGLIPADQSQTTFWFRTTHIK